jgi:alpha-L-fucosidase
MTAFLLRRGIADMPQGPVSRRQFLGQCAAGTVLVTPWARLASANADTRPLHETIPVHLKPYKALYRKNPREASSTWFRKAQFGMMPCYYLASLDGRHWFEQWKYRIPVKEYEKKIQRFTAENFDAASICDLAVEAGMKYVCFVTKHCEGFCLWDTKQTDFNSVNAPANRDLVAEMVLACNKRGLGFFAFYEHGLDWRHPHGPRKTEFPKGRRTIEVPYEKPEPAYAHGDAYDMNRYVDFVYKQIRELLTQYGPIAGVWLDGASVPASGDHTKFRSQELYDEIHRLQPHALISYKWGITGTEDFLAPELGQINKIDQPSKPVEVCWPLSKGWSWIKGAKHENADQVMKHLSFCRKRGWNFLLGIGPLPGGSIHPSDIKTLKEVGRRLRNQRQ